MVQFDTTQWFSVPSRHCSTSHIFDGSIAGGNKLTGSIPSELGLLTKMLELDLEVSSITQCKPFCAFLSQTSVFEHRQESVGGSYTVRIRLFRSIDCPIFE